MNRIRRTRKRPWYYKVVEAYNTYKDVLAVILVVLAFIATVSHNLFSDYETNRGLTESPIPGFKSVNSYVAFVGRYVAFALLTLASFIAWPSRTNRFTKSVMGVFALIFFLQMISGLSAATGKFEIGWVITLFLFFLVLIFTVFLGRIMFLRVDSTDHRLLIRTLRKNKELENLIYKISHDAFMAEVSRAKGWLELIKLKRDEIHDPELLKYLDGLEATFTNMRKKTNSLMNIDTKKFKDFVDTDSKPDSP
ncbi:MAG TPA: hypothetical protein DCE41_16560 [Cytophagales bacterium]|nr:hypothetical protein [Cytophagales bacterium]HAA17623.1 hypothetical protein [Cytophagales bacterium]HAP63959.1 hypothetical protein [Cytophagales bacterium]